MLVRAGFGYTRVIDRDFVEFSNLQRQILFTENHAIKGYPKAVAAAEALRQINSEVEIDHRVIDITPANIGSLLQDIDLLVDGSDNFELRFLINDYSVKTSKPWFYAAALGSIGLSFPIVPGVTPCLRCVFQEPPSAGTVETCETAGIISPAIHAVVSFQVAQIIRFVVGEKVGKNMFQVDVWNDEWRKIQFDQPDQDCPCCAGKDFKFLSGRALTATTRLCGRNAVQVNPSRDSEFDFERVLSRLQKEHISLMNPYLVRLKIEDYEFSLFRDGRAIIKGTDDTGLARSLYSKYIGC